MVSGLHETALVDDPALAAGQDLAGSGKEREY